jgi:hypothetical protein
MEKQRYFGYILRDGRLVILHWKGIKHFKQYLNHAAIADVITPFMAVNMSEAQKIISESEIPF